MSSPSPKDRIDSKADKKIDHDISDQELETFLSGKGIRMAQIAPEKLDKLHALGYSAILKIFVEKPFEPKEPIDLKEIVEIIQLLLKPPLTEHQIDEILKHECVTLRLRDTSSDASDDTSYSWLRCKSALLTGKFDLQYIEKNVVSEVITRNLPEDIQITLLQSFLNAGVNANSKNHWNISLLRAAIGFKKGHLVPLLLKFGAKINEDNHPSETPLHEAVRWATTSEKEFNTLKLLLANKADVHAVDRQGHSSLEMARALHLSLYLPHYSSTAAREPLDEKAFDRKKDDMVKLLEAHGASASESSDAEKGKDTFLIRKVESPR